MQKVLFPMKVLRITQGYGLPVDGIAADTYSHTGSYALDLGGTDTGAEYIYAPCDVVVKRHYKGSGYNAVWFQTVEPVLCADGQQRELVFMFLHANDNVITELGITAGKTIALMNCASAYASVLQTSACLPARPPARWKCSHTQFLHANCKACETPASLLESHFLNGHNQRTGS